MIAVKKSWNVSRDIKTLSKAIALKKQSRPERTNGALSLKITPPSEPILQLTDTRAAEYHTHIETRCICLS